MYGGNEREVREGRDKLLYTAAEASVVRALDCLDMVKLRSPCPDEHWRGRLANGQHLTG